MSLQWGTFADAGFKELVASADPTLNISEQPVSERYTLCQEIGCGSYGRAVLARRIDDSLQVVVKQIRLFEMDEKARMDTLTEAKVLAQFNHVNIVHYYECLLEGGVLNIVMEYANGGDLAAAIQRRQQEKRPFTEDEIMFWFVQVVLALYHVHSKKILHRDLKSQNIFIAEGNLLKLGDFGIARVLNSDTELARTVIGSPYYLSPEICEDRPYNRKSDVWSLGCVLYELATLRRAFDGQSLPALVVKILRGKYPPVPSRYSVQLRSLIESMLKQNPRDRPSAEAILRSDFVRQHVERYAAHVVALGLGPGAAAAAGQGDAAAAAAALGLASVGATEARPRPSPAPHRASRPLAARPPRVPSVPGPPAQAPATPSSPGLVASPAPAPPATAAPSAPGSCGGGGAAEGDRSTSSYDVSFETDTSASTPADGSPPQKAAATVVARKGQRLVESGWVRQQQAALAALEGALQAHKGGAAADGGAVDARGSPSREEGLDATVLAGGAAGPGLGLAAGLGAPGAGASFGGGTTAAKAKLAEARLQREAEVEAQRRANAAQREQKKAAAARRTHEAAVALRNRQAERQKEIERNLLEQKAEMEAKARKAMQLAAAIKGKEDARRREQVEVAQHMSAHREHVRAAKSRINKDQLSELGAQFKARMATALGAGEAAAGSMAQVLVVDFSAAHNQERSSAFTAASGAAVGSSPSTAKSSPLRAGAGVAVERRGRLPPGQAQSPVGRIPRSAGGSAAASDSDGAGPSGRAKPGVQPPWKQRHRPSKAHGFPEVQIFTPFGTDSLTSSGDTGEGEGGGSDGDAQAAAGVLEVLAQIHTVLEVYDEADDEDSTATAGNDRGRHCGGGGGSADDDDESDGTGGGGGRSPGPGHGAAAAVSAATAAANNAIKVEQLRMDLERELGATAFLAAYRCLREMDRVDECDGDGSGPGAGAGTITSTTTQGELERILGAKLHLARHVHKLITLEDAVFA